ncbi:gliding motility-associated-like protein [Aquimarina sp. MAR_2010_214]|uniref:HYR domain-containing protein n=1 Tax=Aquimarina sp. MAR_2010_214 TaxID=1250026 RepID=UPI000C70D134|nr:HYR domain-containing protein [Aquimarina sp. MAR_2010_214]PKV51824.1 gliding motility-associated-like protein [Aquimarina sp. MAR_2010_214]
MKINTRFLFLIQLIFTLINRLLGFCRVEKNAFIHKKSNNLSIVYGVIFMLIGSFGYGQFSCPSTFYQVISGELKSYDAVTGEYSAPISTNDLYNATGYNPVDNFVYAIGKAGTINGHLIRIDSDGSIADLGALTNMGSGGISGDVDDSDNLWINRGDHYDRIENLSTLPIGGSPAVITVIFTGPTSEVNDVVHINRKLYGVNKTAELVIWDLDTSIKTVVGGLSTPTTTLGFGAAFTDDKDRLYVSYNDGGLYLINDYTTGTPTSSFLNSTATTTSNDGFSCPSAPSPIDQDGDDILDPLDLDVDGDGLTNTDESPSDPFADVDGDMVFAYLDDDDADGATGNVDGVIETAFDTDGDGVPDFFDLDSDNDGIYDVVEAGHGLPHTNGRITGQDTGAGTNGLFDGLETIVDSGIINYTIADTDTVGNSNFQSTNSDGDSCSDVREAGFTDESSDGILGPIVVTVNEDGVVTSAIDGYTTPNADYINGGVVSAACSLTPFSCPQNFFQIISGELKSYDAITGEYSDPIAVSQLYNATGYNRIDNYVYAIGKGGGSSPINNHLLRIGVDGAFQDLGALTNMSGGGISGDVDDSDNLWINRGKHYDKIENLSTLPAGGSPAVVTVAFTGGTNKNTNDVVFINGKLYGVSNNNRLINWDLTSLVKTEVSGLGTPTATNFGAAFTDAENRLYVSYNNGGMYLVNDYTTATPSVTLLNNTIATTSNDGFACPTASSAFDLDGDLVLDPWDLDVDNDGIPNLNESPSDPFADGDTDNIFAYLDDNDADAGTGNADGAVETAFDTDGDGVPDFYDLDSDNDGIYDAIESGHGFATSNGRINGADTGSGNNGLFDSIETVAESGVLNYTITNTDAAGDADFESLDSDADGCSDANEAYNDWNADGANGGVYNPWNAATEPLTVSTGAVNSNGLVVAAAYNTGVVAAVTNNAVSTGCEDGDGIVGTVEDEGPNGGDGNGDGILDSSQGNVVSIPIADGTGYVTIETTGVCFQIASISTVLESELAANDATHHYPYGLVDFTLDCITPGDDVTVTYYWHITNSLAGFTYRKYGPNTPGGASDIYQDFTTTLNTTTIGGRTIATASYNLTDGVFGDDTVSDGQIIDPAGPGVLTVNSDSDGIMDSVDLDDDNDGILDRDECDLGGGTFGVELVDDANTTFEITAQNNATTLANLLFAPNSDLTLVSATVNEGSGAVAQIGTFNDGDRVTSSGGALNAFLGFDRGIIFSSGNILELDDNLSNQFSSPNALGDGINGTGAAGGGKDADFGGGSAEFDVASLEIVVNIPAETVISGQFVFASEEYNDYVNSGLNDAPKIFINGTNLALTPSGAQLSIDTVNNTVDSGSYVDNETDPTAVNIEADGFTSTITFSAVLNAGNNTIKIGVADNGDNLYDSWLAFKANSFALCFDRDTDGDNIVDRLDLDSDNDGIYDAVEAGHNQTHVNGVVSGAIGGDGVPDAVQASGSENSGTINYTVADSDSDSNYNFLELDSDADGCDDVIEAGFTDGDTNGYLGNGTFGTGLAVDGNGVVTSGTDGYTGTNINVTTAGVAPSITTQPSDSTICPSANTTFTVVTSNADTYQWQLFNGSTWDDLTDTGIHSTTTTATLNITNALIADNGNQYRVVVSSSTYVCTSETSISVTLTVEDTTNPTITCPATVNVNVDAGLCTASSVALGTPTTGDNCAVASTTNNAPTIFPLGNTTVTWTVTDSSGNTATCTQTVTVTDNIDPTITCPATVNVNVDAGLCTASSVALGTPTTGDNCAVASTTNDAPTIFPLGDTTVTWTVTDSSGNTTTCTQTVTVTDNIDPTITCPATVNVNVDAGLCTASSVALGTPTTGDNCAVASTTNDAPTIFPLGNTTVTWTVTDSSGNTATCTQTVTVTDNIDPTITCPATVNVNVDAGLCTASSVALGTPTTGDNCAVASTTNDAPTIFPLGDTTVTWTVTDSSGNTATCTQTVTVTDNIDPTITCPATVNVNVDAGLCTASSVALGTPTTGDNCAVASTTNNAPTIFPLGDTTVTWTVTDSSGNTATCTQTVTVTDNIDPTITCPATVNVNVDAGLCTASSVALGTPTTGDNCAVASTTNNAPTIFPLGDTTVTWTVTDSSGNTATCTQTVTVTDNIDPTITCPATVNVNVDAGLCTASSVALGTPTTGDNCAVASTTNDAPTIFPLGNTTVTWTVTDSSGNTTTCTQTVTVTDNIDPTITCPATVNVNVDAGLCTASSVALGTPITGDNCAVASTTNNAPTIFPLGDTTVTWTVTDSSGNTATCTQTVTVTDNIDPTITCPATVNVNVDAGLCTASSVALGTPTTGDNCAVASTTNNAPTIFPLGNTTVTWTVTDSSGNTATCTQTVTVTDNIDPTITCPATVNVNVDAGLCTASSVALGTPTTGDNCAVASTTNDAPTIFPLGDTTVTWTVTDSSGNTATCTQTVTVTDNIDPTITCPATVNVNVDAGLCTASSVALGTPTTGDNCAVASTTNDAPTIFPLGDTTVTWTVTDSSGNTATCTQTVTVTDNIDPTITCPATVNVNVDAGLCTASSVALGTPTTGDNCAVASTTNNAPTIFPLGDTTVTWTVTDSSGNTTTCTQTVTVTDNIDPTITCPATVNVNVDAGLCTASSVALGTPTTGDNCAVASTTNDAPTIFPLGNTTVTWTVTDSSGNTATCTQTVTVTDNIDPTITCPATVNVNVDAGLCTASSVALGTPTTGDNCAVASTTNDAPTIFPLGDTTVTWTVTDSSGNTATCTQTVTVTDNIDPTITCPATVNVNVDAGLCTASSVALGTPTTGDNCAVASTTNNAPTIFPLGDTTVTWTVTDSSGNTATCTQTVTVTDNIDPTITCPATVNVNVDAGLCTASSVALGTPTTGDNCAVASTTNNAPTIFPLGNTTVTWTVTDSSGNTATCTQTVTVTDNIDPTITCPATVNVNVDAGLCTASSVALGTPTTGDNCAVASTTNDAPTIFPLGDTTVTWTVTDSSGNTTTCTQTVTVTDNIDPTITCPATVNVNVDAGLCTASSVALGTPTTGDNCAVASTTNDAPTIFPLGDTTVTWTVTDSSGNTTTCTQTVTVTDNIDPTITCPATVNVNVDAGLCTASSVALGTPTTGDNCAVASTTNNAPTIFSLGDTTVTWTVTDSSGNTATCTQTVTVTDNIDPTITCPATVNVNVDAGLCTASSVALGTPTTGDNCAVASTTNDAPTIFPLGDTTVTWTVTDSSGNTATCTQTVTVTDNIDPTITCPATVNVNVDAGLCTASSVALGTPTTGDNCAVASTTNNAPTIFPLGDTTVTWTVTDSSGNTATCTQTVTVTDNIDPTITCPATVNVNVDAGLCTASSVALGTPTTGDNCAVASTTNDAPTIFPLGDTTVTWTVTDSSGNTATCTQTVTVTDNIDPTITCPATVNVNVDAGLCTASSVALGTPTTGDNCAVASTTNDAPTIFPLGDTTVTWTVTDSSGNTATCTQTVTVTDNIDPTITCPATVNVNVDAGLCTASSVALGTPTTGDNCAVASTTNDAPTIFPLGDTTVTWTVTDSSGNTATCTQTVTVTDNIDPTITCPATVNVNVDAGLCTASSVALGTPTTGDNCAVASTTNDAPTIFPLGDTTVTWTVTDSSGNTATCTQTVTVTDNIDPTITCPATVNVNVDAGLCTASSVALGTPTTGDNCAVASTTNNAPTIFPLGDTTVTWTVTDSSGNTATCTQTVTVTDNIDPTITCPATVNVNVDAGLCTASSVALGTPTTGDNCAVASTTNDAPTIFPLGDTTVTWTVTDSSGNTATCTQTVTVTDNIDPTITCPATVNVNVDAGLCTASSVALGTPTTGDNCAVASTTNDAPTIFPLGDTTVTWTVTDSSGNTATCTQTVTVTDNIDPTISCPATVNVNVDAGLCTASSVALGTPTTGDNCAVASTTNNAPTIFPLGDTTVTWTVTDSSGNTATCTQTVTVTDNIDPTITCPATVNVNVDAGLCTASSVALGTPTTGDNCAVASTTNDAPTIFPLGDTTVTWTVTDSSGNTATCTQTVTVTDNIDPTITCPATVNVNVDAGLCTASSVALGTPTTGDNCAVASTTNDAPTIFPLGDTTVTWTVTDSSGNTATCTQTVTVTDNIDPTITCPATVNVNVDAGLCTASSVALGTPTTGDNCAVASTTNDAPTIFPLGDTTVTWTVTDSSGNTATCTQTVTVTDNEAPVANVNPLADVIGECTATVIAPTATDNCGGIITATTTDPTSYTVIGTYTITWTYDDGNGNTSQQTQTVIVQDTGIPVPDVNPLPDVVGECIATITTIPTATDGCGGATTINGTTTDPLTYTTQGTFTVTWNYDDGNGNVVQQIQTVIVDDTIDPTIVCPADVSVNVDAGLCTASSVALGTPTTSDNCAVASTTNDAPTIFPLGDTTVTWTVTDSSGNTATCTQTVTVTDNINPTISCPATVNVNVDAGLCTASSVALGTPTTGDNCAVASTTNNAPTIFPLGDTTVTWTVTDSSGNTATCTQTVTVTDNIDPTITCPTTVNVNVDAGLCTASSVALGTPTTGDNCAVASTTNDAPTIFPLGDTTVTWTVTDSSGNTATCTQTVTVTDNINPTITCPATVNVNVDAGLCTASSVALGTPTTGDNCAVASTTNDAPTIFPLGDTTVTWTVTDSSGNTATCTQTVTVTDNINPTISCPATVNVNVDAGLCTASSVALGTPTTGDNCAVASTTNNAPTIFPLGDTTVTWTVTDSSGNTATCTQIVTVIDNIDPVVTGCPSDIVQNANVNTCNTVVSWTPPTATDNCTNPLIVSSTHNPGDVFPVGTTTVIYTFSDASGNSDTCTFDIVVPTVAVANNDIIVINGTTGGDSVNIVEANDLLDCSPVILGTNVVITGVTDSDSGDGVSLDPITGIVTVLPNTMPGEYIINYTLCSVTTPVVCDDAIAVISVVIANDISNLALTKTASYVDVNGDDIPNEGDEIQYTFTIENTGNVDITNIVLNDPLPGIVVVGDPIDLVPGETDTDSFTATYVLTEEDIRSGSVSNQATVIGQNPNGLDISDLSDDPLNDTNIDLDNDGDFEDETVFIIVPEDIIIYTGITPNGDGINDEFRIMGLSDFPKNTLQIFNRWGVKVFEQDGYEQPGVRFFKGASSGRQTINGKEELPVGTYYYVLEYENASGVHKSRAGYLYINR